MEGNWASDIVAAFGDLLDRELSEPEYIDLLSDLVVGALTAGGVEARRSRPGVITAARTVAVPLASMNISIEVAGVGAPVTSSQVAAVGARVSAAVQPAPGWACGSVRVPRGIGKAGCSRCSALHVVDPRSCCASSLTVSRPACGGGWRYRPTRRSIWCMGCSRTRWVGTTSTCTCSKPLRPRAVAVTVRVRVGWPRPTRHQAQGRTPADRAAPSHSHAASRASMLETRRLRCCCHLDPSVRVGGPCGVARSPGPERGPAAGHEPCRGNA